MSDADLRKWDERYCAGSYAERPHATRLLEDYLDTLPRGNALDIACGAGRNALFLARAGFHVDAIDISPAGLERGRAAAVAEGLKINWICADLDRGLDSIAGLESRYELIVMVRYVNMALLADLIARVGERGCLLCEEHLRTRREVAGPRSAEFRLAPNQLLHAAAPLRVVFYREGIVVDPDGREAALAQLIGAGAGFDV